jgi:hypothetical protein
MNQVKPHGVVGGVVVLPSMSQLVKFIIMVEYLVWDGGSWSTSMAQELDDMRRIMEHNVQAIVMDFHSWSTDSCEELVRGASPYMRSCAMILTN